jgi:hypothetical protein
MRIECRTDPILILGMHRSGTTMVAELLDALGLFLGHELQSDHEATFFLDLNDLMLRQVNAAWDNPAPMQAFLRHPEAVELTARCLRRDVLSSSVRQFLGLRKYLKYRTVERLDRPWGWKEPRTVFTLPLWLKLFPRARLVHIVRNGVDVAASLMTRERRMLTMRLETFERRLSRPSRHTALRKAGYKGSARCLNMAGGFSLWEEYVQQAEMHLAAVANERTEVKYEAFLADPAAHLRELARFCGLEAGEAEVAQAAGRVKVERANAFASDPELLAYYQQVRETPWMRRHGYDALPAEDSPVDPEPAGDTGARST